MDEEKQESVRQDEEVVQDKTTDVPESGNVSAKSDTSTADDGGTEAVKNDQASTAKPDAIKEAQAALADMKDSFVRLQADYANYKKRTANEKLQLSELVKGDVLKEILPVLDNFERALQVPQDQLSEDNKSFLEGYEMIYKQLVTVLEKQGMKKMDAVGKPFNPQFHEAVMRTASEEFEDDTVIEVLQAGYLLGDKTLRPAMVKVAFNG